MFPRTKRLSREDITPSLKVGRRVSSKYFTAILPDKKEGFTVIISKKTVRLAVTRHLIKRRVLAALRALPHPKALILFPKAIAKDLAYKDLKEELGVLLSKISQ